MKILYSTVDAIDFMNDMIDKPEAIITSLPDKSELIDYQGYDTYEELFSAFAGSCFDNIAPKGYVFFIQTDKKEFGLIDKPYLIGHQAYTRGFRMMFHKIALIREMGKKDLRKPTYTHLLCYSKGTTPGLCTPDVLPRGKVFYKHGAGIDTLRVCLEFIKHKKIRSFVDPFAGLGSIIYPAIDMGCFNNCYLNDISSELIDRVRKCPILMKIIKD